MSLVAISSCLMSLFQGLVGFQNFTRLTGSLITKNILNDLLNKIVALVTEELNLKIPLNSDRF